MLRWFELAALLEAAQGVADAVGEQQGGAAVDGGGGGGDDGRRGAAVGLG